jgi:hypothetical protein
LDIIDLQFRVSLFGVFSSINATPASIMMLMNLFNEYNFMPTIIEDSTEAIPRMLSGVNIPMNNTVKRPVLITANNEWSIRLGLGRIDIDKNNIKFDNTQTKLSANSQLGEFTDFINESKKYINILIQNFHIESNRMAVNVSTFLNTKNKDAVYKKFVNPIRYYDNNPPFEWDLRFANDTEIEIGTKEKINVSLQIQRAMGMFSQAGKKLSTAELKDQILITFDTNTKADNALARFKEISSIEAFLNFSSKTKDDLRSQLLERVGNE